MQWPKDRRTTKAMAKRQKDNQNNGQKTEGQPQQRPKDRTTTTTTTKKQDIVLAVLSFGHCFGCPSVFWPLFWLSCLLAIVLVVLLSFGHCFGCPVFWPLFWLSSKRQKDNQSNGQKTEGQPKQWPKDRTTKAMAKRQKDNQTFCLLAIALVVLLSFGHCIGYPSLIYGF
jgi:hypothetical protein